MKIGPMQRKKQIYWFHAMYKGSQNFTAFICMLNHMFNLFFEMRKFYFSGIKFAIDQSFDMITWLSWIAIGVLAVWFHNIGHNISVFYIWILILSLVKKIFFLRENFEAREDATGGDMLL